MNSVLGIRWKDPLRESWTWEKSSFRFFFSGHLEGGFISYVFFSGFLAATLHFSIPGVLLDIYLRREKYANHVMSCPLICSFSFLCLSLWEKDSCCGEIVPGYLTYHSR